MTYELRVWRAYCMWLDARKDPAALQAIALCYNVTEWDIELEHRTHCD